MSFTWHFADLTNLAVLGAAMECIMNYMCPPSTRFVTLGVFEL